jgi:hypothetical protein
MGAFYLTHETKESRAALVGMVGSRRAVGDTDPHPFSLYVLLFRSPLDSEESWGLGKCSMETILFSHCLAKVVLASLCVESGETVIQDGADHLVTSKNSPSLWVACGFVHYPPAVWDRAPVSFCLPR